MKYRNFALAIFLFALFACANDQKSSKKSAVIEDSVSYANRTALNIELSLNKVDSLQIIYYDNPDGDSLRYARFFSYVTAKDAFAVSALNEQLNEKASYSNAVRPCRSEGKIFLYKGVDPLKVLYFSTRCDSCCYVYFIKDGGFIYLPLTDALKKVVLENRSKASKP